MPTIRSREQKNKISKTSAFTPKCSSEQYPWFSFKCMTTNAKYNLSSLSPGSERESTLRGLYTRLIELSSQPWLYWLQQPKRSGLENLKYDDISFVANPQTTLSKDTTLYIFRFDTYRGKKEGRIIGFKQDPCATFHIIGYDIDYSAYDHGS